MPPVQMLRELLEGLVERFGVDAEVEVAECDGVLTGRIDGQDVGSLIGRRGQTIDAIQHLAQRIVLGSGRPETRLMVDVGGYRERRAAVLKVEADRAANEAVRSGGAVELDPAPAVERRLVHEYLRDRGDVRTESRGDEPERCLVVFPLD